MSIIHILLMYIYVYTKFINSWILNILNYIYIVYIYSINIYRITIYRIIN